MSEYHSRFVLKGAFLFAAWREAVLRPTRDMDLLGYGSPTIATLVQVFRALCALDAPNDGLEFLETSVRGEDIREGNVYHGVRIRLTARLVSALIPLQVDIGLGDAITPPAEELNFPTLLDFPAPRVLAYPKPVVVAEKFEALVTLGLANSRLKNFYDLWMLAQPRGATTQGAPPTARGRARAASCQRNPSVGAAICSARRLPRPTDLRWPHPTSGRGGLDDRSDDYHVTRPPAVTLVGERTCPPSDARQVCRASLCLSWVSGICACSISKRSAYRRKAALVSSPAGIRYAGGP